MNIRKIVVVGGMAAGAAFALAPLASADTSADPLAPIVTSEVSSMNFLFQSEALLAGVPSKDIDTSGQFYTIPAGDLTDTKGDPTEISKLLFGSDPLANMSSDPGAYNLMNGAMTEYNDMFNVELYGLLHNGSLSGFDLSDVFGSQSVINAALDVQDGAATATAADAAQAFSNAGWDDMLGYFSLPWPTA